MKLQKIISVTTEKFNKELNLNTSAKVLIGGSYALSRVYRLLDRSAEDIDIIIALPLNFYFKKNKEDNVELKLKNILESLFPTQEIQDTRMSYFGTEEGGSWLLNAKVQVVSGGNCTTLNFLISAEYNSDDYMTEIKYDGMYITPLQSLLKAKGGYNRDKDKIDFYNMTKKLTSFCQGNNI